MCMWMYVHFIIVCFYVIEGEELDEKARGNVDSRPIHGLQGLDGDQRKIEAGKCSSNSAATYENHPAKKIEAECSSLEKNVVESPPANTFEFDLNELPTDEDEDLA